MQATRGRDTAPELALRRELHRRGLRYRVDMPVVPGLRRRADIVFTRARVAVFVDGCYWHGCPQHATFAKSNAEFWAAKIAANQARDADTGRRLRQAGWTVVRVWEHDTAEAAADQVQAALRRRPRQI
jgi:DNA mismatch endonuclease (patch repair protein)